MNPILEFGGKVGIALRRGAHKTPRLGEITCPNRQFDQAQTHRPVLGSPLQLGIEFPKCRPHLSKQKTTRVATPALRIRRFLNFIAKDWPIAPRMSNRSFLKFAPPSPPCRRVPPCSFHEKTID